MKIFTHFMLLTLWFALFSQCNNPSPKAENQADTTKQMKLRGWNILSDNESDAIEVIEAAKKYEINHLQLSHHIIMDLKDARDPEKQALAKRLTQKAHQAGIPEVVVWDHVLYALEYYPEKFRTAPEGKIDLDNPEFWQWLKNDYRQMLDLLPEIDGIILTFIETGAHVEDQYSAKLLSEEEKLAALVDSMAKLIIDERGLKLYIRTFIYHRAELNSLLKCIDLIKHPEITVMTKEVPHDFFDTHPVSWFVKDIKFPVMIEFDATHEYHGQGIIASVFPERHIERWRYYSQLPNVVGYVARTDRYGDTKIINRPSEINLYALKAAAENPEISPDSVYNLFIRQNYGEKAIPHLKPAFESASEIIRAVFYTLGIHNNSHSRFTFEHQSSYSRHVSAKWLKEPYVEVEHGVNKRFHYWKDVVNHLSPARFKTRNTTLEAEIPHVLDSGYVQAEELMNPEYFGYIVREKNYGVELAQKALENVKKAKPYVADTAKYNDLLHTFERTLLTAKMYRAAAKAYFGYRTYCAKPEFQTPELKKQIRQGLKELKHTHKEVQNYPHYTPKGQYDWRKDSQRAMQYYEKITSGWQEYGNIKIQPENE